ncbi:unnamed protein product [Urochloa humidicola]
MDIATGPLGTLLPKLAQLLHEEYKLQKGAREGIQYLHDELKFMHAALEKVGEVPRDQLDKPRRIWAQDVRELSYDMDDIVDTFMVDVEGPDPPSKRGVKKIFKKMMRKVNKAMSRHEVAHEINDIKERAKELAKRRERYTVDIAPAKKIPVDPRLHALYNEATNIVGIEEAKEEVNMMLTGGDYDQKKRIVSIAGFGGLGKTTLAKAVYDDIKKDFGCTAFISVSRNVDAQKLLKDMLYQFDNIEFDDIHSKMLNERLLIDKAIEFLNNKRYLIVIDDIWDKEPWDKVIRLALIENNMRSRIIITTRNIDVAKHVGGCYRLKPLSDESSEKLFYGRIFGFKDKCPNQFSEVSKKILKKCGGVPLAIVTTSSILANKAEDIKVWNDVCDSIGSGLDGNNSSMDDMKKILLLSYYDLPPHLKTCLLYLSIFSEDYEIEKDQLIWRWVAEGFVQQATGDKSFLEIGESYFNELLNRSMIQPESLDYIEGTPNTCRVHDTVLDLIISLSVGECFITTIFDDRKDSLEPNQVRRLSLHNTTTWPTLKMPKLRSLTIFKPANVVIDPTPNLSRNLLLRVLDLRGCNLENLSSLGFLGSLSHLRYLGLSSNHSIWDNSDSDHLPVEIGKLRFLQTLDLYEARSLCGVTLSVIGLEQLKCLRSPSDGVFIKVGNGLKNLTSLEVLDGLDVSSECIAEELGHLTQLRVLKVVVSACGKALVESLGKLNKIESLEINYNDHYDDDDVDDDIPVDDDDDDDDDDPTKNIDGSMEGPLNNLRRLCMEANFLPTWIKPALLPGLCYLVISVHIGKGEDIQVLGTLPCLRHLRFRVRDGRAMESCVVGPDAFPCVVSCRFDIDGGMVVPCTFRQGAMPRLQDLKLTLEPKQFLSGGEFTADDLCLGHLPSLRSVSIRGHSYVLLGNIETFHIVNRKLREKLEHEAAIHPNSPLRIKYLIDCTALRSIN